jgi:HD-GYP domain-containing protein (c-di-GMP phosphodiesterase class II)
MRSTRNALSSLVPALVLMLSLATIAALQRRAATSRDAEAQLVRVDATLTRLQGDPFNGMVVIGGSRAAAYAAVAADQRSITQAIAALRDGDPPAGLNALPRPLNANFAAIDALLPITASANFPTHPDPRFHGLLKTSKRTAVSARRLLAVAGRGYGARADRAQAQATAGSAAMILLLVAGFALLYRRESRARASVVRLAAEALSEVGDAFQTTCSHGAVRIPREAATAEAAVPLADRRTYEHKASWSSASRQSSDVLLKVLSERNADLAEHINSVAELATGVARRLALPESEVSRIGIAAELHDVGKAAIPDAVLDKPGPLDDDEWAFMRQHTLIGERILLVAPSLAATAELVRSSHEAFDGSGYPDGLLAEEIPLGARIIAVCDAFDAMTTKRTYRAAMAPNEAYAELRRCSGTQFDPNVVAVFCTLGLHDEAPAERPFAPVEAV